MKRLKCSEECDDYYLRFLERITITLKYVIAYSLTFGFELSVQLPWFVLCRLDCCSCKFCGRWRNSDFISILSRVW